ncbi:hypothetical protein Tco_0880240 [Tanacetum coccineum]
MSRPTISYGSLAKSLVESIRSSTASAIAPYHAPTASDSEPFEAPASPIASDSDSIEPSFNSDPFSGRDTPVRSVALDHDDEPLGSPDTINYYGGLEYSEDDPSEDDSVDTLSGTDK